MMKQITDKVFKIITDSALNCFDLFFVCREVEFMKIYFTTCLGHLCLSFLWSNITYNNVTNIPFLFFSALYHFYSNM